MLPHEAEQAAHSIAQGRGQSRNPARLTSRSNEDSQPIFFYLMVRYGRTDGPASREHPRQFADSHDRDRRSRRFMDRRLLRRPTHASYCSIVTHSSPDPRHQRTHKHTEAREKSEHEQHDPDAEDPTVKIPCREHDRTSFRKVMCRLIGLCALNMGTFLTLFYTPVVSETSVRSAGGVRTPDGRSGPHNIMPPCTDL